MLLSRACRFTNRNIKQATAALFVSVCRRNDLVRFFTVVPFVSDSSKCILSQALLNPLRYAFSLTYATHYMTQYLSPLSPTLVPPHSHSSVPSVYLSFFHSFSLSPLFTPTILPFIHSRIIPVTPSRN